VYRLDLDRRSHLTANFASEDVPHLVVATRGCGGRATEVACGRDFETVVDPGTYFIAVDGFRPDAFGRFDLQISAQDASGQAAACASAPALVVGRNAGTFKGASDNFATQCGGGLSGAGPDRVYRLSVASRTNVELSVWMQGSEASIALRKSCADGSGGIAAAESSCASGTAIIQTLEPGTYWVVVNADSPGNVSPFELHYKVVSDTAAPEDVGMQFQMRP
jgi:hypothetical protein